MVLAAGEGRRMGGPKATLAWPGQPGEPCQPLAIAHARARLSAESARVVLVVRQGVADVLAAWTCRTCRTSQTLQTPQTSQTSQTPQTSQTSQTSRPSQTSDPTLIVCSRQPDALGPAGSLAAAVLAVPELAERPLVLVTPVDCLPAGAHTVAALLAALGAAPGALMARPRVEVEVGAGRWRHGHPVLLRGEVLRRYARPEPPPLREVIRASGPLALSVDVTDRSVLVDLNEPEEARRYAGPELRFLGAPPDGRASAAGGDNS